MKRTTLLSALLFVSAIVSAQSTLVRGPYLNSGTPESIVIRWRTSEAEVGELRFGTDAGNLTESITEEAATIEHELVVSGLNPATVYHYTIGIEGSSYHTPDGSYYFKTSPVPGSTDPIRMWVMGDFGNGSQAQLAVRDAYMNNFTSTHTDLWIWLGDNAYGSGTDEEYQLKNFDVYYEAQRNMVIWPCPGNHDYGSIDLSDNGPYYDIFTMPRNGEAGGVPSNQERYYSFDYGNAHFVSLNTEYLLDIALPGTAFQQWLEADLAANDKDWVIAFFHQSPYSKGTHDSDENFSRPQFFRQNVLPILEQHGVDLVLTGHSHGYERSYLINGHYGRSNSWDPATMLVNGTNGNESEGNAYAKYTQGENANKGAVYAVVGCSGQKGSGNNELNHPVMYMSTEDYHGSMVIDLEGMELTARFIDTTGTTLDEFTIRKSDATSVEQLAYDRSIYMNAYPNPFRESFTVEFRLEVEEEVTISVSDLSGRLIERVVAKRYPAGMHTIHIAPKDAVANAIYTVEMRTSNNLGAKRLVRVE